MLTIKTRLAEGGWIVIPPEFCQALRLKTGEEVILLLENGAIRLLTRSQAVKRAQELVKHYLPQGRSLADELIAERCLEAENE
jgi:antitoxin component of MazEF toxin-antitoxin module